MAETIKIVLILTIIESKTEEFEIFFSKMREKVGVEEPGTLIFDMHRVKDSSHRYVAIEEYADQAAWDFHSKNQGDRGVVQDMMAFGAAPPEFLFLDALGGPLR